MLTLSKCSCGNSITSGSVKVTDSFCNMLCDGNQAEACGGSALLNIYDSGFSPVALTSVSSASTSSPLYSGPTTVASVGSCYFVGCYCKATNSRALINAHYIDYSATGMTVEKCAASCGPTYGLFGVESSGECYCGNTLQAGSVLMPIEQCTNVCDGDNKEYCGGSSRLGVTIAHHYPRHSLLHLLLTIMSPLSWPPVSRQPILQPSIQLRSV